MVTHLWWSLHAYARTHIRCLHVFIICSFWINTFSTIYRLSQIRLYIYWSKNIKKEFSLNSLTNHYWSKISPLPFFLAQPSVLVFRNMTLYHLAITIDFFPNNKWKSILNFFFLPEVLPVSSSTFTAWHILRICLFVWK